MFCSECGKEIKDNSKFCSFCGANQILQIEVSTEQKEKIDGYFVNTTEIEHALETGQIKVHSRIVSRFETLDEKGNKRFEKHISTAGRFLLSNLLPKNVNNKFQVSCPDLGLLLVFHLMGLKYYL